MKKLLYDTRKALELGVTLGPEKQMEILGLKVLRSNTINFSDLVAITVEDFEVSLPSYVLEV